MSTTRAATVSGAREVTVVEPAEGIDEQLLPGVGVAFKIDGQDTGGALSIVEHPFEPGAVVPPHIHHLEDEISIVLEGEIGFRSEDQEVVLGSGGYIVKPHGEVHAMWNASDEPARMIEIITPAGFERFFRELADLFEAGPIDPEQADELDERYQAYRADPDWWEDVLDRHRLTPPSTAP